MYGELIAAIVGCLVGAGMITTLTQTLGNLPADTIKQRLLYLLAAGWLVLLSVFLLSVLASALEALP
jgi:hypothetical protein